MFEHKITSLTQTRYGKLRRPAELAASKPDTCVKILNKSAYYVIKDCADITLKYLPHFIYSGIRDPITKLKGVVTESDIEDFANRSTREDHTQQLLRLILDDITKRSTPINTNTQQSTDTNIDFTLTGNEDDVYGDYDFTTEHIDDDVADDTSTQLVTIPNVSDVDEVVKILKQALL